MPVSDAGSNDRKNKMGDHSDNGSQKIHARQTFVGSRGDSLAARPTKHGASLKTPRNSGPSLEHPPARVATCLQSLSARGELYLFRPTEPIATRTESRVSEGC